MFCFGYAARGAKMSSLKNKNISWHCDVFYLLISNLNLMDILFYLISFICIIIQMFWVAENTEHICQRCKLAQKNLLLTRSLH